MFYPIRATIRPLFQDVKKTVVFWKYGRGKLTKLGKIRFKNGGATSALRELGIPLIKVALAGREIIFNCM